MPGWQHVHLFARDQVRDAVVVVRVPVGDEHRPQGLAERDELFAQCQAGGIQQRGVNCNDAVRGLDQVGIGENAVFAAGKNMHPHHRSRGSGLGTGRARRKARNDKGREGKERISW